MLCRDVYRRFFEQVPSGQNYFKQSITRLYFIASKAGVMGCFVICGILARLILTTLIIQLPLASSLLVT